MTTLADRITRLHNFVDERLNTIDDTLDELEGLIMAVNDQVAQLQSAITDMQTAQSTAAGRINTKVDAIESQLQAALANQTPPPDLTAEIQAIRDETTALTNLQPDTTG